MRLSALPTDRTPAPRFDRIPAELKARNQWVVWRLVDKRNGKKPAKMPYTADANAPAGSCDYTDPANWRSYEQAVAFYRSRPGYFTGIGYVFAPDDPYVGGDIDHCIVDGELSDDARQRLPATYAEISQSGDGVKFIARATGEYGRKTTRGELYSSKRFFAITGRVLPGHEQITECQAEVEAFHASLGGREKHVSHSSANGNRAQLAADIPEAEWEAARQLSRTDGERVERRVRAAGEKKPHSLLCLLLDGDYEQAHKLYPGKNLYRADGTLDDSQVRFWIGQGIYGRGFTFIQYVVAMSRLCAASALAKWGSKELWRQELAAMWAKYPNYTTYTPRAWQPKKTKVKRGRAGNHAALVEQVYQLLVEQKAGAQAIVKTSDIAGVIGVRRETIARILKTLRGDKEKGIPARIETRPLGQHGGLVVTFPGVIYSDEPQDVLPQPVAPNDSPPTAAPEETEITNCVSSDSREADHSSVTQQRCETPPIAEADHSSRVRCLADAVREAFDAYADRPFVAPKPRKPRPEPEPDSDDDKRRRIKRKSRGARRAPITRQMVEHYVAANFPSLPYTDVGLDHAIAAERQRRKLAELPNMAIGALKEQIRLAEHLADGSRRNGDRAWRWWLFYRDAARAELAKRPAEPGRPVQQVCEVLLSPSEVVEQFPHRRRERLTIYRPGQPPKPLPLADLPDMSPHQATAPPC